MRSAQAIDRQRLRTARFREGRQIGDGGGRHVIGMSGEEGAEPVEPLPHERFAAAAVTAGELEAVADDRHQRMMIFGGMAKRDIISRLDRAQIWKWRSRPPARMIWVTGSSVTPAISTGSIIDRSSGNALGQGCSEPLWLLS
jgi:hypothetical protein